MKKLTPMYARWSASVSIRDMDRTALEQRLRKDLKEELMVTPEIRIENFGTLERTTFKAKRIVDKRNEIAIARGLMFLRL